MLKFVLRGFVLGGVVVWINLDKIRLVREF